MKDFEVDKRWSDRFLPEIKRNIAEELISEPPVEEDQERNTDLMVLRLDTIRVACRVRRPEVLRRYGDQFTIREGRLSGKKTELRKIIEGWGDYMFYGFAAPCEKRLAAWVLLDLSQFRVWFVRELHRTKKIPGIKKYNHDGSGYFRAFVYEEINRVVPGFVVLRSQKAVA